MKENKISRKDFILKGAVSLGAGGLMLAGCQGASESQESPQANINFNKSIKWKMCTTWPSNFPVLGEGCVLFAERVKKMSGGRLEIEVYGDKELVPAFEIFDAVSIGAVEMGHGAAYYWAGRVPEAQFFASVPFGMNAQQMTGWMHHGGGLELWQEIYEPIGLLPMPGGNTGVQMGGWFNREVNVLEDLKGLKMRIPGLGGKVMARAGVTATAVAGSEVFTSLERGLIDATEWIGPYHDYLMGFHKIAQYYYYPGFHEPGTTLELIISKEKMDSLPDDLREIVEVAARWLNSWILSEFEAKNAIYLQKIIEEAEVDLRPYPQPVLEVLREYTREVVAELTSSNANAAKVYKSYDAYRNRAIAWARISEGRYYHDTLNA